MTLPRFIYHPDPLATGAIVPDDRACSCCDQARGFLYKGQPYGRRSSLRICPWCIADGSAAKTLGASFVQDVEEDVSDAAADEVLNRTPGYESWQGEMWLGHCGDACEFHGDATREDLDALTPTEERAFLAEHDWLADQWDDIKRYYQPKGDTALYRFVCRHCGTRRLGVDMS